MPRMRCAQAVRQRLFTSPRRHGIGTLAGQLDRLVQHEASQLSAGHSGETMQAGGERFCMTRNNVAAQPT